MGVPISMHGWPGHDARLPGPRSETTACKVYILLTQLPAAELWQGLPAFQPIQQGRDGIVLAPNSI